MAITPAAGFVNAQAAILIGAGASTICYFATQLKGRLRVDDALDVWSVHGVGARTWGALATGLFATLAVNGAGANGLVYGDPSPLGKQAIAVVVTWVYSGAVTWLIVKGLDITVGLRVQEREEVLGLDASQHGEMAYQP